MRVFFSRYYRGGEATLEANVPRYREITSKAVDLMIFFLKRMQDVPSYGIGMRVREVNTVLLTFEAKVTKKKLGRDAGEGSNRVGPSHVHQAPLAVPRLCFLRPAHLCLLRPARLCLLRPAALPACVC